MHVNKTAECSKIKLYVTSYYNSAGYYGTITDHSGKVYQSTYDFKLEYNIINLFCRKDCVTGCDAKGECNPGGFGLKFANYTKCPLNVCCSKHGYCGTTKDFCRKKTINCLSCSAKGLMQRVIIPASSKDLALYRELTRKKKINPKLKDTPKSWLSNYLNSYTNLTKIIEAIDLL
ncbi:hypothetical protein DER46DRAFT_625779 [Fusarium sp. MPI-SDFR-AT-0072]|nr:hypothetical protein DER46DRAFT_625779 [Fusarium sp. MPI-SDFR-AT-0072]